MVFLIAAVILAVPAVAPPPPEPAVCSGGQLLTYSMFAAGYENGGEPCSQNGATPDELASGALRCINGLAVAYDRPTRRFQNTGRSCSPQVAVAPPPPPRDDRPRGPPPM